MSRRPNGILCSRKQRRGTAARTALAGACLALLSGPAFADVITPPPVPSDLEVPAGHVVFRAEHAVGTQNFVCIDDGGDLKWAFFGPQATLFSRHGRQTATHFLSANPDEEGPQRPAWQDSRDTSSVWAQVVQPSSDPAYVDPEAIPWLLLRVVGWQSGPSGGRRLIPAQYLQRVNTAGGKAPGTGCSEAEHVGAKALVPYEADYVFYRARNPRSVE